MADEILRLPGNRYENTPEQEAALRERNRVGRSRIQARVSMAHDVAVSGKGTFAAGDYGEPVADVIAREPVATKVVGVNRDLAARTAQPAFLAVHGITPTALERPQTSYERLRALPSSTPPESFVKGVSEAQNPFVQFVRGVGRGVGFRPASELATEPTSFAERAGQLGQVLGTPLGIFAVGSTGSIVRGLSAGQRAVEGAAASSMIGELVAGSSGFQAFARVPGVRLAGQVAFTSAEASALVEGSKRVSQFSAPAPQREAIGQPGFREAVKAGFAAETQAVGSRGILRSIAYEVTPFLGDRAAFERGVRESFVAQGLSGAQLESSVQGALRQRTAGSIGETGALLEISRQSERIGRRGVTAAFEKGGDFLKNEAFGKVFKKTFFPIAKAGVSEGVAQEVAQSTARERDVTVKNLAFMGAFGFGTAGVLGSTIAGTAVNRKGVSKTIETITYLADPFEKPGDLLQDVVEAGQRRLGRTVPVPAFLSNAPQSVMSFTTGKGGSTPVFGAGSPSGITPTFLPDISLSFTATPVPVSAPVSTPTPVPTPSIINTLIGTPTPTPVGVPSPVPVPTPTPVPIPELTPVPVNTPVPVPVLTPTPVPVVTPFLRLPPPVPLKLDVPSGLGFGGRGGRKLYFNELAFGSGVLSNLVGGKKPFSRNAGGKEKKKKGRKRIPTVFDPLNIL